MNTVLVNGQDLNLFGSLESFEESIPEIDIVSVLDRQIPVNSCEHNKVWDFYNSWNTYDDSEQKLLFHYSEATGLNLLELDSFSLEAFDNYFGNFSANKDAAIKLISMYTTDWPHIAHLFTSEILDNVCLNNLIEDDGYYYLVN